MKIAKCNFYESALIWALRRSPRSVCFNKQENSKKKIISTFTNVQMNINFKKSKLFLSIANL